MEQKRIFALALAAAVLLGGCSGGLGAEPTVESEVITATGQDGVAAAMEASNAPYIKRVYHVIQLDNGELVPYIEDELNRVTDREWFKKSKDLGILEPTAQELTHQDAANRARDIWDALGYERVPEWKVSYFNTADMFNFEESYFDCEAESYDPSMRLDSDTGRLLSLCYTAQVANEERDNALSDAYEWFRACKYHTPREKTIDAERVEQRYADFAQSIKQTIDSGTLLEQAKAMAQIFEVEPVAWYLYGKAYPPTVAEYLECPDGEANLAEGISYCADLGNGTYFEFTPELSDTAFVAENGYARSYGAAVASLNGQTMEEAWQGEDLQKLA